MTKHFDTQDNDYFEQNICTYAKVVFSKECKDSLKFEDNDNDNHLSPFDRLKYGDVTNIELIKDNDQPLIIRVPWRGNGFKNKAMKFKETEHDYVIEFKRSLFDKIRYFFLS